MGLKRDASLATFVLVATILGLIYSKASLSVQWLLFGGGVTVALEALAYRRHAFVRGVWERPIVQVVCLGLVLGAIAVGSFVAPSFVFSTVLGGSVTYLAILGVATTTDGFDARD